MFLTEGKNFQNRIALLNAQGESYTYGELDVLSEQFALKTERAVIMISCDDHIGSYAGYYFALSAGLVPLLIDASMHEKMVQGIIEKYQPRYLWMAKTAGVPKGYRENFTMLDFVLYEAVEVCRYEISKDLALLLTTSGSTGSSKYVRISYENIRAFYKQNEKIKITPKDRMITTLSISFVYGWAMANLHWANGASIFVSNRSVVSAEFWKEFRDFKITNISGVPYLYELLDKIDFLDETYENLNFMTVAGGKMSPALIEKFSKSLQERQIDFLLIYGQTEATGALAITVPNTAHSLGKPLPQVKISVRSEDNEEIKEPGVAGELVFQTKTISLGYAQNKEDLAGGNDNQYVLPSGDLGYFDEDGQYYILGRKKRFLKITGRRINLDEVEELIKQETGLEECVCAGEDDSLKIYITDDARKKEIQGVMRNIVKVNRANYSIQQIEAIPRNSAGKILYGKLN